MELSEAEITVVNKAPEAINFSDHTTLVSARDKLLKSTNKKLLAACCERLAMSMDRSRVPHDEKARHWEVAATKAQEANVPCSQLNEFAADYFGRDMSHKKSAELFEASAKQAIIEKLDEKNIRRLFQGSRRQFELTGDTTSASKIFILENDYRLGEAKGFEKSFLFLFKILSSYGESPIRVAISASIVIISCAAIYYFGGIYSSKSASVVNSLTTSTYFSVVTFTTLGYGDYSPATLFTRIVASFQAISGLLLTSLFLVTIVRKYSR